MGSAAMLPALRIRSPRVTAPLVVAAGLVAACAADAPGPAPRDAPTYHAVVRPLLERNCTMCHAEGGVGPMTFTDHASVLAWKGPIVAAIESGRMPPWMPSADCRSYDGERRLEPDEVAAIRAWADAGGPEGDPATYVAPPMGTSPLEVMGPPSLSLTPAEPYTPKTDGPDDYHCFPLDHTFSEETYLVMTNVVPGRAELVHHVIIYLVAPEYSPQLDALDAAEDGLGYTCFAGTGVGAAQTVGGWVPGTVPAQVASDAAIRIPKGGRLVMQVHYNTLSGAATPDQTRLDLWFRAGRPEHLLTVRALAHLALRVPPDEPSWRQTRTFTNTSTKSWTIVATTPHMHLLGQRIALAAVHADRSETCLVDIPRWDFHWQQSFRFRAGEHATVAPGEAVRLDCWYDNSAANQPVIGGVKRPPADVRWGEGTLDEMCLGYVVTVEPYTPVPERGATCVGFQACYDACVAATPKTGCALQCSSDAGPRCSACVVPGLIQCAVPTCPTVSGDLVQCVELCQTQPDTRACVRATCLGQLLAFDQCVAPLLEDGTCDAPVSTCDADL
ncbi:hypothetical protein L6R52_28175 [Myxococcota bacterium]|nr:hypothetical protein [Myxococcota bacterium]